MAPPFHLGSALTPASMPTQPLQGTSPSPSDDMRHAMPVAHPWPRWGTLVSPALGQLSVLSWDLALFPPSLWQLEISCREMQQIVTTLEAGRQYESHFTDKETQVPTSYLLEVKQSGGAKIATEFSPTLEGWTGPCFPGGCGFIIKMNIILTPRHSAVLQVVFTCIIVLTL